MADDKQNGAVAFGDFIRSTRVKSGLIARDVAAAVSMLPSNFSKLEHGILLPPKDAEKQRNLLSALGIKQDSEDATRFMDLAAKATDSVPIDLADLISKNDSVPLLLRTIGNKRLTDKDIERLIEIVHAKE